MVTDLVNCNFVWQALLQSHCAKVPALCQVHQVGEPCPVEDYEHGSAGVGQVMSPRTGSRYSVQVVGLTV